MILRGDTGIGFTALRKPSIWELDCRFELRSSAIQPERRGDKAVRYRRWYEPDIMTPKEGTRGERNGREGNISCEEWLG